MSSSPDNAVAEWRKATQAGGFLLGFSCFLSFFANVLMLTTPMFMLLVYDGVLASRSEATLVALLIIAILLILLHGMIDFARRRIMARFGAQFQERLERIVTAANFAKNARNTRAESDVLMAGDLDKVRGFLHSSSLTSVFDVLWTPLLLGLVFVFNPLLGWMSVVGLIVLIIVFTVKSVAIRRRQELVSDASSDLSGFLQSTNISDDLVKSQRMFPSAQAQWNDRRTKLRDVTISLHDRIGWYDMMARQLLMIMRVIMLALGAYLVMKGSITTGVMIASVILLSRVFYPVENFLRQFPKIAAARESWKKLRAMVLQTGKRQEATISVANHDSETLRVDGLLVKGPGDRGNIVRGVSFDASPGKIIQVVGSSGSGKSVLSRAITGSFPFQGGRLSYAGRSLAQLTEAELGDLFGYVPDRTHFFPGTVAENISKLAPGSTAGAVVAAAKKAGIHDTIETLPNNYDNKIDLVGRPLSVGEAKRVALARALYGDPRILVIDDHAGLFDDKEGGEKLTGTIKEFVEAGGCVIVFGSTPTLSGLKSEIFELTGGQCKKSPPPKKLKVVEEKSGGSNTKSSDGNRNDKSGDDNQRNKTKPRVVSG